MAYSHYLWIPSFRFIATTRYKLDYSSFGSQWNRCIFIFRYSEHFSYILLLLLYIIAYKCSSFVVDWQEQRICAWYFWPLCQTIIWFMFYSFIVLLVRLSSKPFEIISGHVDTLFCFHLQSCRLQTIFLFCITYR